MTTIRLPWPPSVNNYWHNRTAGKPPRTFVQTYLGREGKAFRRDVLAAVLEQLPEMRAPSRDRLRVWITATMPDRRKRDLDNLGKATLDALTHAGVWEDDSQIYDLRLKWSEVGSEVVVQSPGWLDVEITRIKPAEVQPVLFGEGET